MTQLWQYRRWRRRIAAAAAAAALAPQAGMTETESMTVHDLSVEYHSSEDPNLALYAAFIKTGTQPKPICAYLHGWHGNRYYVERDLSKVQPMLDAYFLISVDMRGRGSTGKQPWWGTPNPDLVGKDGYVSGGVPDANGWELNDIVDAIEAAKQRYPEHTLPDPVYVIGNSGGGGNVMGIIGKFPDYFAAAYADCGMSDYARWAELVPDWRPSIEEWIGAKLGENQQAFASRGGLTTVQNRLTPTWITHGDADTSVPIELSQLYVGANAELGKPIHMEVIPGGGHSAGWGQYDKIIGFNQQHPTPPELPNRGRLVVAGYLKTRRFQVILPSINAVASCEYDLKDAVSFELAGGLPGTVRVRVPAGMPATAPVCTVAGRPVVVTRSPWHDWQELRFEYRTGAKLLIR